MRDGAPDPGTRLELPSAPSPDTTPPAWDKRLTRGGKLRRGAVTLLAVLLAACVLLGGPAGAGTLAAQTWQLARSVVAPPPPPAAGTAAPWSLLYGLEGDQLPPQLARVRVTESPDGRTWTTLPPLPVPGTNAEQTGIYRVLGIGPGDRLLVFGPEPGTGLATLGQTTPTQGAPPGALAPMRLWAWDPHAGGWEPSSLDSPFGLMRGMDQGRAPISASRNRDGTLRGVYLWVDDTWPAGGDTLDRAFLPAQAGG
jgi:hypothetical protein